MPPRPAPAPPDQTHDALYRAVVASPRDDLARLVLADYLEERGRGDDRDRAAAIRLQLRVAGMGEWDDGYTETEADAADVIRRNLKRWTADVPGWADVRWPRRPRETGYDGFVGGYPGAVMLRADGATAADRLSALPVADVWAYGGGGADAFRRVAERFPTARVGADPSDPGVVADLAGGPPVPGLTRLRLTVHERLAESVRAVAFPPVAELGVFLPTAAAAETLAGRARPAGLRELYLHAPLTAAAAARLAAAGWADGLRRLDLVAGDGQFAVGPLLNARGLGGVRTLTLWADDAPVAAAAVAASGLAPVDEFELRAWNINARMPHAAVLALVCAPALTRVRRLSLPALADPDAGLGALGGLPGLRGLELTAAGATRDGLAAAARSPAAVTLRRLTLIDLDLTAAAGAGLADGPGWPELAALAFSKRWPASDGGAVAAVVDGPRFPRLTSLDAGGTAGATDLWRRLAKSDAVARFRRLRLAFPVTDVELGALLDNPAVRAVGHLALPVRRGITAGTRRRFERAFGVPLTADD